MKRSYKTLLLNADYYPLKIISWKKAMSLLCRGKVTQVDFYKNDSLRDGHGREYPIPAVIILNEYKRQKWRRPALSKKNIWARDKHQCQYCLQGVHPSEATVDHVIPKSKGGLNSWENLVTACFACNSRKKNRTCAQSGMFPANTPYRPSYEELFLVYKIEKEWEDWLSILSGFKISTRS